MSNLDDLIASLGIRTLEPQELLLHCEAAIAANPRVVQEFLRGKAKALDSLIGPARKLEPNIDPVEFKKVCLRLINNLTLPE